MKFNHKDLNLPFHPGDPLYWIDVEDHFAVKEDRINAVIINEHQIQILQDTSSTPEEVNAKGSLYNYTSKKKALEEADRLRDRQKAVPEISGEPGIWYYSKEFLPVDDAQIIVKTEGSYGMRSVTLTTGQAFKSALVYKEDYERWFWMLDGSEHK